MGLGDNHQVGWWLTYPWLKHYSFPFVILVQSPFLLSNHARYLAISHPSFLSSLSFPSNVGHNLKSFTLTLVKNTPVGCATAAPATPTLSPLPVRLPSCPTLDTPDLVTRELGGAPPALSGRQEALEELEELEEPEDLEVIKVLNGPGWLVRGAYPVDPPSSSPEGGSPPA